MLPEDTGLFDRHVTPLNAGRSSDTVIRLSHRYGAVRDVTERKVLEQEPERQTHTDFLPGLANRRHQTGGARTGLDAALPEPLCLVMLDLGQFQEVNDIYGHEIGDRSSRPWRPPAGASCARST